MKLAWAAASGAIIAIAIGLEAPAISPQWTARPIAAAPTTTTSTTTTATTLTPTTVAAAPVPAAVTAGVDMRAGPVLVPLQLQLPTLGVNAAMLGVGMTANNVMDAPMGKADNPVWQTAFWYRGSAIPGELSTALIAGHVGGPHGTPGVFRDIHKLVVGDPIVIHDTRNGLDVHFAVTELTSYPLDQTTDPVILTRMYGAGPVAGTWAQPSEDGLAHLTLVTCAGTFVNGTHDERLVVFATRVA